MQIPQFWPHGPNFDQISQIPSVTAIYVKKISVKNGPVWKFQIFDPSEPPKPKIGPQTQCGLGKRKSTFCVHFSFDLTP